MVFLHLLFLLRNLNHKTLHTIVYTNIWSFLMNYYFHTEATLNHTGCMVEVYSDHPSNLHCSCSIQVAQQRVFFFLIFIFYKKSNAFDNVHHHKKLGIGTNIVQAV